MENIPNNKHSIKQSNHFNILRCKKLEEKCDAYFENNIIPVY